jgi:hypothetical protein
VTGTKLKPMTELLYNKLSLPRGLEFRNIGECNNGNDTDDAENNANADTINYKKSTVIKSDNKNNNNNNNNKNKKKGNNNSNSYSNSDISSSTIPKNLFHASQIINHLEKTNPTILESVKYDIEILLGNKSAVGKYCKL